MATAAGGARRRARERALDLLYEAEMKGVEPATVIAELPVAPDTYARSLAEGVGSRRHEIDELVGSYASGWALGRLPAVDRQLLRLGTYELLAEPDVPPAVVIDEAVELAKAFSTEESGRYVNGVLAAIGRRLGRIVVAEGPPSESALGGSTPAESGPAESATAATAPSESALAGSTPGGSAPAESGPAESATAGTAPGRRQRRPGELGGVRARPSR